MDFHDILHVLTIKVGTRNWILHVLAIVTSQGVSGPRCLDQLLSQAQGQAVVIVSSSPDWLARLAWQCQPNILESSVLCKLGKKWPPDAFDQLQWKTIPALDWTQFWFILRAIQNIFTSLVQGATFYSLHYLSVLIYANSYCKVLKCKNKK